jgi:hypothetical protein
MLVPSVMAPVYKHFEIWEDRRAIKSTDSLNRWDKALGGMSMMAAAFWRQPPILVDIGDRLLQLLHPSP